MPPEIVLAVVANAEGSIITQVADVEEATIVFGVLERGSNCVMLTARTVGEATALRAAADAEPGQLELVALEVECTEYVGMGERVCVDTYSHFRQDENILVGSHSRVTMLAGGWFV